MITFDYNPDTKECVLLKQEQVKEKAQKASTKAEEVEDSAEPQITLESNKYVLNKAAASLMGVEWENRLDIKYQPIEKGGLMFPIIGTDTAWKTKSGNKLTKSLTVSCRGNANDLLSKYGDTFTVTPWKGHDGLFVLVGNKDIHDLGLNRHIQSRGRLIGYQKGRITGKGHCNHDALAHASRQQVGVFFHHR